MIRHTSRVVVCGRMGNVRVCNEPLYSSGIMTRNTDEHAGNEDDRNYSSKRKLIHQIRTSESQGFFFIFGV